MPRCSVIGCKSERKIISDDGEIKLSFFRFPGNTRKPELLKQWVDFCKQTKKINLRCATICSRHFSKDQFVRDFNAELLNIPSKKQLKRNTVPTKNGPKSNDSKDETSEEEYDKTSDDEDVDMSEDSDDDVKTDRILRMKYEEHLKEIISYQKRRMKESEEYPTKDLCFENLSLSINQVPIKNQRRSEIGIESIYGARGRQLIKSMDVIILTKTAQINKYMEKAKSQQTTYTNMRLYNKKLIEQFDSMELKLKALEANQDTLEKKLIKLAFVKDTD